MWPGATPFRGEAKDGRSNTILLAENNGLDIHWMEPRDLIFADMSFELQAPGGISSRYKTPAWSWPMTRFDAESVARSAVVRAMATANGGEKLTDTPDGWKIVEDGRDRELR